MREGKNLFFLSRRQETPLTSPTVSNRAEDACAGCFWAADLRAIESDPQLDRKRGEAREALTSHEF